jgi:hypothetical protein
MWLRRILFHFQTRLREQEEQLKPPVDLVVPAPKKEESERVELFKNRLIDLDRRMIDLKIAS